MNMMNQDDFLTVSQAAQLLGHSVQHTRLLIRQAKLTGNKIGRDWVIPRTSVVKYKESKANVPLFGQTDTKRRHKYNKKHIRS